MTLTYSTPINYLQKIKDATAKRNLAISKISTFSEYNSQEQEKRKNVQMETINSTYTTEMDSISKNIEQSLEGVDRRIYMIKFPLMNSPESLLNDNQVIGFIESQSGTLFALNYSFSNFPTKDILNQYFKVGRYDFLFSMTDIFLNKPTFDSETTSQKQELSRFIYSLYNKLGILELMNEKVELEFVKGQHSLEFNMVTQSGYQLQYATKNMILNQTLERLRKELNS